MPAVEGAVAAALVPVLLGRGDAVVADCASGGGLGERERDARRLVEADGERRRWRLLLFMELMAGSASLTQIFAVSLRLESVAFVSG